MTQQTLPPPAIAPVWFIAHGGPPTLYQPQHPAHQHWLRLGRDIRRTQPKGIVFVSAHWQAEPEDFLDGSNASGATDTNGPSSSSASAASRRVLINTDSSNPLIYDFYGFPKHYYEANFASHNPPVLHEAVSAHLRGEGYTVQETQRGIDHGVWVPLLAAFGERGMLDGEGKSVGGSGIPLVQVSLPIPRTDPRDDGAAALALGHALRGLRQQGIAVVGGGQPVHNLRDYRLLSGGLSPAAKDHYSQTFPPALTAALLLPSGSAAADASNGSDGSEPTRWAAAKALFSRADYAQAHPTSEHLLREFASRISSVFYSHHSHPFSLAASPSQSCRSSQLFWSLSVPHTTTSRARRNLRCRRAL